ncbi:TIGR04222 domain-containing membrane protein [Kitasatospora sp. RB6PN24]|uniref:TIGR04222 domain-containing membrane protein n=1 Tax=Kitasatospora humi TaxID=2893891 RepID=UPI001E2A65F9|nr:TIGR04222 domain-containing membrane protein [Kitasatospora humi]MCC9306391.1 TIGR04222 domain-containing membrane protein [Kitasatospora humi]
MWLLFLVPACVVAVVSCLRLVRAAATADAMTDQVREETRAASLGLYETAYLAGGPSRVVELALVLMSGRGRLHLAHTGWTTVVDPVGRNRLERALIDAIGPEGQCRTGELRQSLAGHPAVAEIGVRLSLAGLATPVGIRENTLLAVRQVRQALVLAALLLVGAMTFSWPGQPNGAAAFAWFSLPLILTTGTLLMARVDVHPYTRWAAPAGQRLLEELRLPRQPRGTEPDAERLLLTAVAMGGAGAVPDARLRMALRG